MRHYRKTFSGLKRGTALLLSILILTQITVAAVGLGTLVINSLQQARFLDNSIAAYYAAESAVEQGIYTVRRVDVLPDSADDPYPAPTGSLGNNTKWERTVSPSEREVIIRLSQDSGYELDLIDFDSELISSQPQISKLRMSWDAGDCGMTGCPVLNVSAISLDPYTTNSWEKMSGLAEPASESDPFFSSVEASGVTTPFVYGSMTKKFTASPAVLELVPGRLNIVRLRVEVADIDRLTVQAYADAGEQVPVPGRVRIEAVGRMGGTEQRMIVKMPRRPPLMGIYDFAVFSECSLVKGHPIRCP